jgi:hypothetical protein
MVAQGLRGILDRNMVVVVAREIGRSDLDDRMTDAAVIGPLSD